MILGSLQTLETANDRTLPEPLNHPLRLDRQLPQITCGAQDLS